MLKLREKIEDKTIQYFGFEHNSTLFIFKLLDEYEDNEHNNKCIEEILNSLIELEHYKNRF